MHLSGLQFDHIPNLNVPFRFFITAALFAIGMGAICAFYGTQIWYGRWMPTTLAITHTLGLGVMAMIMFGSMFQLLPVLCGAAIQLNKKTLFLFHSLLTFGVALLVIGFLGALHVFTVPTFLVAGVCLFIAFTMLLFTVLRALLIFARGKATRLPMLMAVFCLMLTVLLGGVLLVHYLPSQYSALIPGIIHQLFLTKALTNVHAGFAFLGWIMILVMAVGFQVIPMFHVCPPLSANKQKFLPIALFLLMVCMAFTSITALFVEYKHLLDLFTTFIEVCLALVVIQFSVLALKQLKHRKRKLPDNTVTFWQLGLISLIFGMLLWMLRGYVPELQQAKFDVLFAGIIALGFVLSIMQGMLLKIVPFLITLHLQRHAMKYPMKMGLIPDFYSLISRQQGTLFLVFSWLLCFFLL